MIPRIHQRRHTTDTVPVTSVTLKRRNEAGTSLEVVNLTGKTVKFKAVNAATGVTLVAETETGVTVETAASGTVKYDWQTAGAASAGIFRCYFVVYTSTETEHFPAARDGLIVGIDSETQTAEEAYEASL